jgi:hypothetical protein
MDNLWVYSPNTDNYSFDFCSAIMVNSTGDVCCAGVEVFCLNEVLGD